MYQEIVMFFLKIYRWLIGYVTFCASGGFTERFLNLCTQKGIVLNNVSINEKSISADIRASQYRRLRETARLSGSKICCKEKHGLVFFIRRNENRAGLAIGGVFFVVFMCIVSLFVWNVETTGSEKLSRQTILAAAEKAGVYPGALRRNIDQYQAAESIITTLNGKLSWVSVNIKGSHAVVEVRDYVARREDETYSDPCNIVADFDGELLSVEVHNGTKACPEGSGVKKGDLIISGIFENRDTSCIFMEARGIITAIHDNDLTIEKNLNQNGKSFEIRKTVRKIGFFGLSIPLGFFPKKQDYEQYEKKVTLYFGKTKLPFYICEITRAYYNEAADMEAEKKYSLFFDDFSIEEHEKYKNSRILNQKLSVQEKKETIVIKNEIKCIDFMGVKQKIEFDTQNQQNNLHKKAENLFTN